MTRTRVALLLVLLLGGLAVVGLLVFENRPPGRSPVVLPAAFSPAPESAGAGGSDVPNGLDFSNLSPAQVSLATQILAENRCNCNCGMTLLECRAKDPGCSRSVALGRQVVEEIRSGKDRTAIQASLGAAMAKLAAPPAASPTPDANRAYHINTAGAPYRGPKSAKVTIVEFSDYQ